MKILSIDTSCDETSVAVTEGTTILSNVLWSQASMHAEFGGVMPSLAQRAHREHIDWVVTKALKTAFPKNNAANKFGLISDNIDAIAVTIGNGLSIALGVGVDKAKELSENFNKPFIAVNHTEGHLLSPLSVPKGRTETQSKIDFPVLSLVASGKHTDLIYVSEIGNYKVIAHTVDDALGEALDKTARMLGLGYPGGPVLEKLARYGNTEAYILPIPMIGQESRYEFSYSGLKTAMWKLVEKQKPLTKEKIQNLAAAFQNTAFKHVERLTSKALEDYKVKSFLFGGGVAANVELRKRLRKIANLNNIPLYIPYSKKLCTDNAGMIGVAAFFKGQRGEFEKDLDLVDREPNAKIDKPFKWQ